jgi:hypothetical protein
LILAGCWVLVMIAVVVALAQGDTKIPVVNGMSAIVPGFALVPGAYLSVKLRRTKDPEQIKTLWPRSALYGAVGLILGIGTFVLLAQVQKGAS